MKLKDLVNQTRNRRTNQISFNLRIKWLRKIGLTPEELLELTIPKPKVKFYKKWN